MNSIIIPLEPTDEKGNDYENGSAEGGQPSVFRQRVGEGPVRRVLPEQATQSSKPLLSLVSKISNTLVIQHTFYVSCYWFRQPLFEEANHHICCLTRLLDRDPSSFCNHVDQLFH